MGNILSKIEIGNLAVRFFEETGSKIEDFICKNYLISSMICLAGATFIAWKYINTDFNDYTLDEHDLPYVFGDDADQIIELTEVDPT